MTKGLQAANDVVLTNPEFAKRIVNYFQPSGSCLDPCRGEGAFYSHLPETKEWCEITQGKDFLSHDGQYDWIITNPPWSAKVYRAIAQHAFDLADHVVFLIRLDLAIGTYARRNDYRSRNHGLNEIIICKYQDAGFAQKGFALAVLHWQKNYTNNTKWTYWL